MVKGGPPTIEAPGGTPNSKEPRQCRGSLYSRNQTPWLYQPPNLKFKPALATLMVSLMLAVVVKVPVNVFDLVPKS